MIDVANALFISYGVVWAVNAIDAYLSGTDGVTVDVSAFPDSAQVSF